MSASPEPSPDAKAIDRLVEIMARLRAPGGCPWDREQTPVTLKPQLLEECYEVLEAIDSGSATHLTEELGDLLLHIVFQAQIAREAGDFSFAEVANGVADKLIRRHPHVFGSEKVAGSGEVVRLWDELKKAEKPERDSALDGVPASLPALMRAEAIQKRAHRVGFDWPDVRGAMNKVKEEMGEVAEEIDSGLPMSVLSRPSTTARIGEELGDLLFSVVNLARHLKLHPEELLTAANDKFTRRFRAVEEKMKAGGKAMKDCTLEELDAAWDAVKSTEKQP